MEQKALNVKLVTTQDTTIIIQIKPVIYVVKLNMEMIL